MSKRPTFPSVFLQGEAPSRELLIAFVLGLMVTGVASNLLYDLLVDWSATIGPGLFIALAAIVLLTLAAYGLYRHALSRYRTIAIDLHESPAAAVHDGLIWIFGPGEFKHLITAIEHHMAGGGGRHCWLIMQNLEPIRENLARLYEALQQAAVELHPVYVDKADVHDTYVAGHTILSREIYEAGLEPDGMAVDITGGTKVMTAGLLLAAVAAGVDIEYVESLRADDGSPIEDTAHVVAVESNFILTRE